MIINKLKFLFLISLFTLGSCSGGDRGKSPKDVPSVVIDPERCIRHDFQQGADDHLYGRECIEGKEIKIKSASQGEPISLMSTSGGEESVVIEEGVDFINAIYDLDYKILKSKGDYKKVSFLRDFIAEGEEFQGVPDQKYTLIFETVGNYLILYKTSEDKNNIPYNERTSMRVKKKGGKSLYMVPFIGYPIEYCQPEFILNAQQEITKLVRAKCDSDPSEEKPYLHVNLGRKQVFKYENKQDVFPSDYFEGEWFFAVTSIDSNTRSELASADSRLVKIKKESDALVVIDDSGDIREVTKQRLYKFPVNWLEFELDKKNALFEKFGERLNRNTNAVGRPHLKILFKKIVSVSDVEKVVISPDYFSFVYFDSQSEESKGSVARYKVSLLRKAYLNFDQFKPRRWFREDRDKNFNFMPTIPQDKLESRNLTEEELNFRIRILKFDTSLYTEEEKKSETKIIKWYFSKNSTKESQYRDLAQEAMAIYNRGFEIIAGEGESPKIQFQLIENEDKDLGDMRYNIMNLIKIDDLSSSRSGLFGFAPSHHNPETGQTISTVSNIAIHETEERFITLVRNYTRYEIFQRPKLSEEENKNHVVSDYIRWKIQKECKNLSKFIDQKRGVVSDYRTELGDFELIKDCAVKVARPALLSLILHEMGHNCSKGHNFECSRDQKNFYKDLDEMKKYFPDANLSDLEALKKDTKTEINPIPKSSCVMDYNPFEALPLTVLGKNDLMVLRYIYEDELELAGHELEKPVLHPMEFDYADLKKQRPLANNRELMKKKKIYLNCSDYDTATQLGCDGWDYGVSYKEIAENLVLNFKRSLKSRYVYDLGQGLISKNPPLFIGFFISLQGIQNYHIKWIKVRNEFLASKSNIHLLDYYVNNEESIDTYLSVTDPNHPEQSSSFNQDYKDFYPISGIYGKAVKTLWSQRPLHCVVESENGTKENIEFNYLVIHLNTKYDKGLYVIDCYSDQVVEFLNENRLKLIEQYGIQNFGTFAISDDEDQQTDIIPLSYLYFKQQKFSLAALNQQLQDVNSLKDMDQEVKKNLLDINYYGSVLEIQKNKLLLSWIKSFVIGNKKSSEAKELYKQDVGAFVKNLGTDSESFYKKIEEPLQKGYSIEAFKSSFLKKLYEDYINSGAESSFESYVQLDKGVALIENRGNSSLYIPVKEGSFSHKMILKYNEVLKEITELEARNSSELSLLEKFHKVKLDNFRDSFSNFIHSYSP